MCAIPISENSAPMVSTYYSLYVKQLTEKRRFLKRSAR